MEQIRIETILHHNLLRRYLEYRPPERYYTSRKGRGSLGLGRENEPRLEHLLHGLSAVEDDPYGGEHTDYDGTRDEGGDKRRGRRRGRVFAGRRHAGRLAVVLMSIDRRSARWSMVDGSMRVGVGSVTSSGEMYQSKGKHRISSRSSAGVNSCCSLLLSMLLAAVSQRTGMIVKREGAMVESDTLLIRRRRRLVCVY